MRPCLIGLIFLTAALAGTGNLWAETITLEADNWLPYNGDGVKDSGYMLDIMKAVFEPKGYQIVFRLSPWNRAIEDGRAGACSGIVGAAQEDAPDFIYPAEEEGLSTQEFYTLFGSSWKYQGIASLKGVVLAVVNDYTYFPELDKYIKNNPKAVYIQEGADALVTNLKMMLVGRHNAVVDDSNVLKYITRKLNIEAKVVSAGKDATKSLLYVAFSPVNPKAKEWAKILSDGISDLRKTGELRKILAVYGLKDWK